VNSTPAKRNKGERNVYKRLKPFTILGAAIALGIIGFDPNDPVQFDPVEQQYDDMQVSAGDFDDGAPEFGATFAGDFQIYDQTFPQSAGAPSPPSDKSAS